MRVDLREMTETPVWADGYPIVAPFGGRWHDTIKKLEYELHHIDVDLVVIELTGERVDIRRDGWVAARSKLDHPVIVSFEHPDAGHLQYRSGHYSDWQSNVHAVALTLERLRAIDRYGCAPSGQQYTGWAALPEKSSGMSEADAMNELCNVLELSLIAASGRAPKSLYRQALRRAHPDHGGDRATLEAVQEAGRALGLTN